MNVQFHIKNEIILLRADSMNYELCRIKVRPDKNTGERSDEWEPFKFFATLDQAICKIIDMKVRASEARSLKELREDLVAARDEICLRWQTGKGVH